MKKIIFVSGEFSDSLTLFHPYRNSGSQFLAIMKFGNLTNIVNPSKLMGADYSVFPNPSENHFTLQLNEDLLKKVRNRDMIFIFDELGTCILRQQFSNSITQQIDVSKMTKGIYFVEAETREGRINKKIIRN